MSVTSGFFNSLNGDRRYNAEQMSAIFDGIINDGVFASIGDAFKVTVNTANTVNVGIGRAWFNSTWIYNDSILPITAEESEVILDRYDAVVIEVDKSFAVRAASIKIIKGVPASTPSYPTLSKTSMLAQYPLAFIRRKAGATSIGQADIINAIGTSYCPYITGILEVVSIDNIVAQWEAQWEDWSANWEQWEMAWDKWLTEQTEDAATELSEITAKAKADFDSWFNELQAVLEGDVATELTARVLELQNRFHILAMERAVYEDLEDSTGDELLDSDGHVIEGRTVMGENDDDDKETTFTGDLDMKGNRIINLAEPIVDTDAATRKYVHTYVDTTVEAAIESAIGVALGGSY